MIYYLSLGSNVGDRLAYLKKTMKALGALGKVIKKSSIYQTEPIGVKNQYTFLNMVVALETDLNPDALLTNLKEQEKVIGRNETFRWGPREIDLDIIDYSGDPIATDKLKIPHKEYENRNFVLIPMQEIEPLFKNRNGVNIEKLISICRDTGTVDLYFKDW